MFEVCSCITFDTPVETPAQRSASWKKKLASLPSLLITATEKTPPLRYSNLDGNDTNVGY